MSGLAWVGGEERYWRPDAPPVLAAAPPDQPVDVTFEGSPGGTAEVLYTLDGSAHAAAPGTFSVPAATVEHRAPWDVYAARIPGLPDGSAVRYTFRLRADGQVVGRPAGWTSYIVSSAPTSLDDPRWSPEHPQSVLRPPGPAHPSPVDWRSVTAYHLLLDRFCDGEPANNRLHYAGYAPASAEGAHGGDIAGLRQRLDYVAGMGFTAVWISPVQQNWEAYHGFGVCDFLNVDRRLGTLADLRAMSADAHARGLAVILDIPLQHMAGALLRYEDDRDRFDPDGHPVRFAFGPDGRLPLPLPTFFRDATVRDAPRRTFGRFHRYGRLHRYDDQGAAVSEAELGDLFGLSDLDTEAPEVREAMVRIAQYWIAQADIDGFRLDAVKHADLGFWQHVAPAVRAYARSIGKERFLLVGESLDGRPEQLARYVVGLGDDGTNAPPQCGGSHILDGMEDYPLYFALRGVLCEGGTTETLATVRGRSERSLDPALNFTFLDNHDQRRLLDLLGGRRNDGARRLRAALALLLFLPGIPVVYYGTEQGFDGAGDHRNREDMFFNPEWCGDAVSADRDCFDPLHPLYRHLLRLHQIREAHGPLRAGGFAERWHDGAGTRGVYVFSRIGGGQEVVVAINVGDAAASLPRVPLPGGALGAGTLLEDVLSDADPLPRTRTGSDGALALHLEPWAVQVWAAVPPE